MPHKPGAILRVLQSKFGFSYDELRENSHSWLMLQLPGGHRVRTKLSRHKEVVGRPLEGRMARQLRVRGPYFEGMLQCTHSREDYIRQVMSDPYPPWHIPIV